MNDAHISLTELCLKYLSLPAFSYTASDTQLRDHALSGTYAFLEYALASWTVHIEHTLDTCDLPVSLPVSLTRLLQIFFEMHWKSARKQTRPTKRILDLTSRIAQLEITAKIKDSLSSMHCVMTNNLADLEPFYNTDLFSFLTRVRAMIETLAAQPDLALAMQPFYGHQLYRCPRIYCKSFHEGFVTIAQRDSHVERHDRSHLCSIAGCLYATYGFPKSEQLAKHLNSDHPRVLSEEDFSSLVDGITQVEGNVPGISSAGGGANTAESRRQQKNPAMYACHLCPKRLTRVSNLRSHLLTHTNERPFICTVCGKAWARRHDCRRHERLHEGEKKFVCKGSLQSGASWGCGRQFARADAPGRHFRSEAGRICIKPLLDEEAAERQKTWMEEQQQAQVAAGLLPLPITQPHQDPVHNFQIPAALLQQYPALAGLDWSALNQQGPPLDEEVYDSTVDEARSMQVAHITSHTRPGRS
jgi:hypothetical protein